VLIYKYKRKKSVIQYQITDYLGKSKRVTFDMTKPKQYQAAKLTMSPLKSPKPRGRPPILQSKYYLPLEQYMIPHRKGARNPKYLTRFRIPNLRQEYFNQMSISAAEKVIYTEIPYFRGHFEDIFLFNPIFHNYCHEQSVLYATQGLSLPHPLIDYFIYEMARIHTGNETYSGFLRNLSFFNPLAFQYILEEPQFIPIAQDFSEFFHQLPLEFFYAAFYHILSEFLQLRIISFRILIWDCQFIHTNGADYKIPHKNKYSDRDAGIGRHQNKFLGLGYMASTLYLYCGALVIPVFCMIFPANISDKEIFHTTMEGYFLRGLPRPYIILGDAGAYSIKNLRFLAQKGIIGIINATKNIVKQNIVDLREDIHINRDFVPSNWSDSEILEIYNIRTEIERRFSHNVQIYHVKEVNVRGIDQVTKHRFVVLILDLLKELTAVKLGRLDILGNYTSFSSLRSGDSVQNYLSALKKEGFRLFQIHQGKVSMDSNCAFSKKF
jgi:hypothetical protein